jgi:uncharacterized membrane protein
MMIELLALRVIHILGGIFWLGTGLFMSFFLVPALATPGVNGGQVFASLQKRRFFSVLPLVALLTIASGLRLMWITSGGYSAAYFATPSGRAFAASGAAAIVAFTLSLLVSRPTAARMATIGASLGSAPAEQRNILTKELARLRRRGARATAAGGTLLVLGAAGMAMARYLS